VSDIVYKALVAGTAAGIWAAIIWFVRRIKNGPPPPEEPRGPPLTRQQMLDRLRGITDDPEASPAERQRAKDKLDAVSRHPQSS
jgi:hypothetical protein